MILEEAQPAEFEAWDAFVASHPDGTLYHSTGWQSLTKACFGHPQSMLMAKDSAGEILGVLPLTRLRSRMFGHFSVSLPYVNLGGALGKTDDIEVALMRRAQEDAEHKGASHVEFRDRKPRGDDWAVRTDKVEMELSLPESPEVFMQSIGSKLRSQVKRPTREGAVAKHGGGELVADFYRVFAENMRDLGTPVYGRQLFDQLLRRFPDEATVTVVYVGAEPAAAGITISHRGRTEIPWASSLRRYNRISVNMLLYAEVIKRSIERGDTLFDFGRSTKDAGTYKFKKQWGAEGRQLYWHYGLKPGSNMPGLTPDNPKYALAIRMWQKLPVPMANMLGPHLVKYLP